MSPRGAPQGKRKDLRDRRASPPALPKALRPPPKLRARRLECLRAVRPGMSPRGAPWKLCGGEGRKEGQYVGRARRVSERLPGVRRFLGKQKEHAGLADLLI